MQKDKYTFEIDYYNHISFAIKHKGGWIGAQRYGDIVLRVHPFERERFLIKP